MAHEISQAVRACVECGEKYPSLPEYWQKYNWGKLSSKCKLCRRADYHNQRARRLGAEGSLTASDLRALLAVQCDSCHYCGAALNGQYHVEHKLPLSRGGPNVADNIVLSCKTCNLRKHHLTAEEFQETPKPIRPHRPSAAQENKMIYRKIGLTAKEWKMVDALAARQDIGCWTFISRAVGLYRMVTGGGKYEIDVEQTQSLLNKAGAIE